MQHYPLYVEENTRYYRRLMLRMLLLTLLVVSSMGAILYLVLNYFNSLPLR